MIEGAPPQKFSPDYLFIELDIVSDQNGGSRDVRGDFFKDGL